MKDFINYLIGLQGKITDTYTFFGLKRKKFLKEDVGGELHASVDVETFSKIESDHFVPVGLTGFHV